MYAPLLKIQKSLDIIFYKEEHIFPYFFLF